MTPSLACALLLSLATVLAWLRLLRWQRRREAGQPSRHGRLIVLLLAQPVLAGLLYLAMFPPQIATEGGRMLVLTAGATDIPPEAAGETRVALPEAPAVVGAERVPDLATALRRHPGTQGLQIIGAGLETRDRDAARDLPLIFTAPPEPNGLVELEAPSRAGSGDAFTVRGRVHSIDDGQVELLDPAGQVLDRQSPDEGGRFHLAGTTRVAGLATYAVRIIDSDGQPLERMPLPLRIDAPSKLRVLVLAGAPNPELKYLRRWIVDAGFDLHTRIDAGAGVQLGDGPVAMDAASLGKFDLLVLDERAWQSLSAGQRRALTNAVGSGLGLLLRATGPLPSDLRRQLQTWGLRSTAGDKLIDAPLGEDFDASDGELSARLHARIGPGTADAPRAPDTAATALPVLQRRDLRITGEAALPILHDVRGQTLAAWTAHGRGRIGVIGVTDSYRLALGGRGDRHGELWSRVFATLARGMHSPQVALASPAWQDSRIVLCELNDGARLLAPDGQVTPLLIDPIVPGACAAAWPQQSGWHWLQQGEQRLPFYVFARDDGPGLQATLRRDATLQLAAQSPASAPTRAGQPRRGPSWPWLLGWLLLATALWWFERRKRAENTEG
ncbi:hypothetical protein CSC70_01800 [Pseudoxanthomonas kalamensis DSM 18571]|uniref:carboxypeptidase regulatory-like domain-containing protein n=1 Tax=Pseudoxanthomonas kalamensis TaxID=289483 RepID=UPI0013916356|nr:carboxypeptidase regulatory-like domain-containing protein [Pseudoxanthomonas kalamensis]KAF1712282.1 hypothetical protein CSC70_01800 [Pseudoxanthomonas kalamensis DSM 18571]